DPNEPARHRAQTAPEAPCEQQGARDEQHPPPHERQRGEGDQLTENRGEAPQHDAEMNLQERAAAGGVHGAFSLAVGSVLEKRLSPSTQSSPSSEKETLSQRQLCFAARGLSPACQKSVRFRPDDALRARFAGERTGAGLALLDRDAADGDAEIVLDALLELDFAAVVREREACMNRRGRILGNARGREEGVEILLRIDLVRVLPAESPSARGQTVWDRLQRCRDIRDEPRSRNALLLFRPAVA